MTTTIEPIPETLDIGCTTCGQRAVQILIYVEGRITEVIETACRQHAEEATNGE